MSNHVCARSVGDESRRPAGSGPAHRGVGSPTWLDFVLEAAGVAGVARFVFRGGISQSSVKGVNQQEGADDQTDPDQTT